MTASATQVIITAILVLSATTLPFLWGLYRLTTLVREHDSEEDGQMM